MINFNFLPEQAHAINLRDLRGHNRPGVPTLLPYGGLVDDGVVALKDGSLIGGWEFLGADLDSSTDDELTIAAAHINAALRKLGTGYAPHVDAYRYPINEYMASEFPDPTSRLIEDCRQRNFTEDGKHYAGRKVLCLTWKPPIKEDKASRIFVENQQPQSGEYWIERFKGILDNLQDDLSVSLHLDRLGNYNYEDGIYCRLLEHLHFCVTGIMQRVRVPPIPMFLDAVIGGQDLIPGATPIIGDFFVGTVSIDGFPQECWPSILDRLDRLPIAYRWASRNILLDQADADRVLVKYDDTWTSLRHSVMGVLGKRMGITDQPRVDMHADAMSSDVRAARAEAAGGTVKYGYVTNTIVLMHPDESELRGFCRYVKKQLQEIGFNGRIEHFNGMEAYLGSLPGNTSCNVRRPLMSTLHHAYMLPMTSVWQGHTEHPCRYYPRGSAPLLRASTDGGTPYNLYLHESDSGHALIVGPTGSGKSGFIGAAANGHRKYKNARIVWFDIKLGGYIFTKTSGGKHFDLGKSQLSLCPLKDIHDQENRIVMSNWLQGLFALAFGDRKVTPEQINKIDDALKLVAQSEYRSLTHLQMALQDEALREAIHPWTIGGGSASFLDAEHDGLGDESLITFESETLLSLGPKVVIPTLMLLFQRVESQLDGRPTIVIIDEAWQPLKNPLFRDQIESMLRKYRSKVAGIWFATQSANDIANHPLKSVLAESCKVKVWCANPEAGNETSRPAYEDLGLNKRQIDIVRTEREKRDYYLTSPSGNRRFELELTPAEVALCASTGTQEVRAYKALEKAHGERAPAEWLRAHGLEAEATQWEQYACL